MITPYQKPEDKDSKANNFWTNLAGKLGLSAPIVRQASAAEQKGQRLSDGIQKHSDMARANPANLQTTPEFWDCECEQNYIHPASQPSCTICGSRKDESPDAHVNEVIKLLGVTPTQIEDHGPAGPAREASIQTVSGGKKAEASLLDRYTGVFHRAVAELGQSERVKAADRLSRIEADMAGLKDKLTNIGGDRSMADLVGEVSAKADSLSGACVQLRTKVDALSSAQANSIENAFFVLSDAKTEIDKIKSDAGGMGLAMTMEMGAPMIDDEIGGDLPEAPAAPEAEEHAGPSPIAGHVPAMMKAAADAGYDSLRLIHTKLSLVDSMMTALVSELAVGDLMGAPVAPGAPPEGMPPMEEMGGEQKEPSAPLALPEASLCGRMGKFAGSGDPGDTEPGNLIYKSLDNCRNCVWFESDYTHETYRDKCKHCTHATLGGAIEHFWPRAQQMVMWIPSWSAPVAKEKKAFTGTLSLIQTAKTASVAALNIATDILDRCEHTAVDLGTSLVEYFQEPVIAKSMPILAHEVASEIERVTGIEIALTQAKMKDWGHKKGGLAEGEVSIACDPTLMHLAKGEKRKIKELRQQLDGEKGAEKIKALNDAIDALYSRIDADKKRKDERRQHREEKQKKDQESTDKEPAKFPATASFEGTLCLAKKSDHEDGGEHDQSAESPAQGLKGKAPKDFKVAAVSSNQNSFGLFGLVLISASGEAWQAAHTQQGCPQQGQTVQIAVGDDGMLNWAAAGFEIPNPLPKPPVEVVNEVWGKQASSAGRSL